MVSLLQFHGHQFYLLPIIHRDRAFCGIGQGPAAAQQAGLRGVGRVARTLIFVKRNEHMNRISGIGLE